MKRLLFPIFSLVLILSLCSCGKEIDEDLLGTWESQTVTMSYTFQSNGKVQMNSSGSMQANYSADGEKLTISFETGAYGTASLHFEYQVGWLTNDPDQEILILKERESDGSVGTTEILYKV